MPFRYASDRTCQLLSEALNLRIEIEVLGRIAERGIWMIPQMKVPHSTIL